MKHDIKAGDLIRIKERPWRWPQDWTTSRGIVLDVSAGESEEDWSLICTVMMFISPSGVGIQIWDMDELVKVC